MMCGMLSVMDGKSFFSSVLASVDIKDIGADVVVFVWFWDRYDVDWFPHLRNYACVECECVKLCV